MYYRIVPNKKGRKIKSRKKRAVLFVVLLILSLIAAFVVYSMSCAAPTIIAYAKAKALSSTTQAVNKAVYNVLSNGVSYNEIVTIEKNTNNEVVLVSANSVLINYFAKSTALNVQESVNSITDIGIGIPWGTLTGFPILTGKGGEVNLSVSPVTSVLCFFKSEFKSAGINQTLHQIYLSVCVDLQIILPTEQATIKIEIPVMIAENIIVGAVPQAYLSGSILGSVQTG